MCCVEVQLTVLCLGEGDQKFLKLCLRLHGWSQSTLPLNTTGPFSGLKLIKESIKKDTG